MKKIILGVSVLLFVFSFSSTIVRGENSSIPSLVIESNSIDKCQKKMVDLTKKLKSKIILNQVRCSLNYQDFPDYQVVYRGSILFY